MPPKFPCKCPRKCSQQLPWINATYWNNINLFALLKEAKPSTGTIEAGNTKEGSITVLLTSCLTGLESAVWLPTIFCFYLQNRLIQTSQTGGLWYSDTSPFSIPWLRLRALNYKWAELTHHLSRKRRWAMKTVNICFCSSSYREASERCFNFVGQTLD